MQVRTFAGFPKPVSGAPQPESTLGLVVNEYGVIDGAVVPQSFWCQRRVPATGTSIDLDPGP